MVKQSKDIIMTRKKLTQSDKITRYQAKHPDAKPAEIAKATGASISHVYNVMSQGRRQNDMILKRYKSKIIQIPAGVIQVTPVPTPSTITGVSGNQYKAMDFTPPAPLPPPNLFERLVMRVSRMFA
jgi:hypothetical protein